MSDDDTNSELEIDEIAPDTQPPPVGGFTWLDQFKAFTTESLEELAAVADGGLEPDENDYLIMLSAQLLEIAKRTDPEALSKLEALLSQ